MGKKGEKIQGDPLASWSQFVKVWLTAGTLERLTWLTELS